MRIIEVNGAPVSTAQEFGRALESVRPGDVVALTLLTQPGGRVIRTIRVPQAASPGR